MTGVSWVILNLVLICGAWMNGPQWIPGVLCHNQWNVTLDKRNGCRRPLGGAKHKHFTYFVLLCSSCFHSKANNWFMLQSNKSFHELTYILFSLKPVQIKTCMAKQCNAAGVKDIWDKYKQESWWRKECRVKRGRLLAVQTLNIEEVQGWQWQDVGALIPIFFSLLSAVKVLLLMYVQYVVLSNGFFF